MSTLRRLSLRHCLPRARTKTSEIPESNLASNRRNRWSMTLLLLLLQQRRRNLAKLRCPDAVTSRAKEDEDEEAKLHQRTRDREMGNWTARKFRWKTGKRIEQSGEEAQGSEEEQSREEGEEQSREEEKSEEEQRREDQIREEESEKQSGMESEQSGEEEEEQSLEE